MENKPYRIALARYVLENPTNEDKKSMMEQALNDTDHKIPLRWAKKKDAEVYCIRRNDYTKRETPEDLKVEIAALKARIESQEETIASQAAEIALKNSEIGELRKNVDTQNNTEPTKKKQRVASAAANANFCQAVVNPRTTRQQAKRLQQIPRTTRQQAKRSQQI
jgi:hypothetical protein